MRWRISIFFSIAGEVTLGDCRPSRRVSSSNSMARGGRAAPWPVTFQS
jgi:hypothetical protein